MTFSAGKIDSTKRVSIQGLIQTYIDHSISSTINLPEDIKPEVISNIYLKAWKAKLKGVTIYRDGSRFPILSTDRELTTFQKEFDPEAKAFYYVRVIEIPTACWQLWDQIRYGTQ